MTSLSEEIVRSVRGAVRIAMFDAGAPAWFNLTLQGFWRSFLAPVLLAPFYLLLIMQEPTEVAAEAAADPGGLTLVRIGSFVLGWIAFPLLMIPIARLLQLSDTYVSYIIMWNWSAVPQAVLMIPATAALGLLGQGAGSMLLMAATVTVLFYGYLVARAGLRCPAFTAAGVVALDVVLSLVVNAGLRSLLV